MQIPNVLETPGHPNLPKCENDSVGSISRDVVDLSYVAGIFDGEGCIHVDKKPHCLGSKRNSAVIVCTIRNTNPYMIRKISEVYYKLGLVFFYAWTKEVARDRRENLAITVASYGSAYKLLMAILPYLIAKKKEAETVIDFLNWRKGGAVPIRALTEEQRYVLEGKINELYDNLRNAKQVKYGSQRLPREASKPLDLSNLEIMV